MLDAGIAAVLVGGGWIMLCNSYYTMPLLYNFELYEILEVFCGMCSETFKTKQFRADSTVSSFELEMKKKE